MFVILALRKVTIDSLASLFDVVYKNYTTSSMALSLFYSAVDHAPVVSCYVLTMSHVLNSRLYCDSLGMYQQRGGSLVVLG
jgi:hypothetical protein